MPHGIVKPIGVAAILAAGLGLMACAGGTTTADEPAPQVTTAETAAPATTEAPPTANEAPTTEGRTTQRPTTTTDAPDPTPARSAQGPSSPTTGATFPTRSATLTSKGWPTLRSVRVCMSASSEQSSLRSWLCAAPESSAIAAPSDQRRGTSALEHRRAVMTYAGQRGSSPTGLRAWRRVQPADRRRRVRQGR